jgi:hypothetical protein
MIDDEDNTPKGFLVFENEEDAVSRADIEGMSRGYVGAMGDDTSGTRWESSPAQDIDGRWVLDMYAYETLTEEEISQLVTDITFPHNA